MAFYDDYNWGIFDQDDMDFDYIDNNIGNIGGEGPVVPDAYDPYKDEGPSQLNPDVIPGGPDLTLPDLGTVDIVDDRPVAPSIDDIPDMGTIDIVDKRPVNLPTVFPVGPEITLPPYNPPLIEAPDLELPVIPEPEIPDLGTIDIVDKRPVTPPTVFPPGPEITLPPYTPPIIEAPDILLPVPPVEEPPVLPPELPPVLPPVIPPYVPPVVPPETPPVLPPVIPPELPPVVPPVVAPPVVPPVYVPPVAPQPQQRGMGLNPGFIAPTDFYKTFDPAQSKYNWGSKGFQVGPDFDARQYNQAAGSEIPWGLQQLARGLTGAQINDIIAGKNITTGPAVPNAQRMEAYDPRSMAVPSATNSYQVPTINAQGTPNTGKPNTGNQNVDYSNNVQYNQVAAALGPDLARQQQEAIARGDTAEVERIQSQYEYVMQQQQNQGGL